MPLHVSIKDLRDITAFNEMVSNSSSPIIVTKNGCDRVVRIKSSDFSRWKQASTRTRLLERIMISEREQSEGLSVDAFEVTESLREKYNL